MRWRTIDAPRAAGHHDRDEHDVHGFLDPLGHRADLGGERGRRNQRDRHDDDAM